MELRGDELAADKAWNDELSKVRVETADDAAKRIFYTALYHTMVAPSEFCDANGDYRGADGQVRPNPGYKTYTTFSLWDTYRAYHPLLNLIRQDMSADIANSMLRHYDRSVEHMLPIWSFYGNETWCMIATTPCRSSPT